MGERNRGMQTSEVVQIVTNETWLCHPPPPDAALLCICCWSNYSTTTTSATLGICIFILCSLLPASHPASKPIYHHRTRKYYTFSPQLQGTRIFPYLGHPVYSIIPNIPTYTHVLRASHKMQATRRTTTMKINIPRLVPEHRRRLRCPLSTKA